MSKISKYFFQLRTLGGCGDSNCRNLERLLIKACIENGREDIEFDFSFSRGGLTTLKMQDELYNALNSEVSPIIFWLGSNEIEYLLMIKEKFGIFAFWDHRNDLLSRIIIVLNELVGVGKFVYVLSLPIRIFFNRIGTQKILDQKKTLAYKSCAWNVTNRLMNYCMQVESLYYITLPTELYYVNLMEIRMKPNDYFRNDGVHYNDDGLKLF